MKEKKIIHILSIMRRMKAVSLMNVEEKTGHRIHNVSDYERLIRQPFPKTLLRLADVVDADPEVLYYSFGMLPDDVMKVIRSDPFYYMEKLRKLCDNHKYRYGKGVKVDLNDLNKARVFDYLNRRVANEKKD